MARTPLRFPNARGEAYVELGTAQRALLEQVARDGVVPDAVALKAPRVWRRDEWVFKLYPRRSGARRLRLHPALASARAHAAILPVASPAPVAALAFSGRSGPWSGMLVSRYVAGHTLAELWRGGTSGRAELARFLAQVRARGVWHGDLHPGNLLFDGRAWWMLDLDALRPRRFGWLAARGERECWARLHFNLWLDPALADVHRAALREAGEEALAEARWSAIARRAQALARERGADPWRETRR